MSKHADARIAHGLQKIARALATVATDLAMNAGAIHSGDDLRPGAANELADRLEKIGTDLDAVASALRDVEKR